MLCPTCSSKEPTEICLNCICFFKHLKTVLNFFFYLVLSLGSWFFLKFRCLDQIEVLAVPLFINFPNCHTFSTSQKIYIFDYSLHCCFLHPFLPLSRQNYAVTILLFTSLPSNTVSRNILPERRNHLFQARCVEDE